MVTFVFITRIVPNWISNVKIVILVQGVIIAIIDDIERVLDENNMVPLKEKTSKQDDNKIIENKSQTKD